MASSFQPKNLAEFKTQVIHVLTTKLQIISLPSNSCRCFGFLLDTWLATFFLQFGIVWTSQVNMWH